MTQLILITTALRLIFAALTGLGVDESYMVTAGRTLSLGYFDHPPASWWLSWGAAHLFQTESALAVRLPFILLFAQTTWLVGQLAGGGRAGLFAALALNLSPVFGLTAGTWVLPDGPLDCALAAAALCLTRALPASGARATAYWAGAGIAAGIALFSKYSAILTMAGAFLFLLSDKTHRHWLTRPHPYAAALLALAVFSPVPIWNAEHHWASFAFQGARAGGLKFRPWLPFVTLAGEALFVLPWFWVPMIQKGIAAFRTQDRLLAWLAAPPILLFALVSAWSSQRILYHWAAPGYLMLFPLLGRALAAAWPSQPAKFMILGTAALCLAATAIVSVQIQTGWIPALPGPTAEGLDWTSLRAGLTARGLLKPGTVVGAANWRDAGKIGRGLGAEVPILCLNPDSRQFGFAAPLAARDGEDILLVIADRPDTALLALQPRFDRIEPLPPSAVTLNGRVLKPIALAIGHRLHAAD